MGNHSKRGFAALPPERVRELARQGGKACQESGKAHRFTPEEARIAGKKGAEVSADKRLAKRLKAVADAARRNAEYADKLSAEYEALP